MIEMIQFVSLSSRCVSTRLSCRRLKMDRRSYEVSRMKKAGTHTQSKHSEADIDEDEESVCRTERFNFYTVVECR